LQVAEQSLADCSCCPCHGIEDLTVNLNVLLRGQSNAFYLGEFNGGAQAMIRRVEALLGFDGVNDRVTLQYASGPDGNVTVAGGTGFLNDWLEPRNGNWNNGWQVDRLEQSLLNFIGDLGGAQKAQPTAVVWLHSEYDSRRTDLTPAEWESAVRFDASLVRDAYGQSAASLPYLFVSAIPYFLGTDQGHQAIRIGMENLAADPGFNARIAARALDTDMSLDDLDNNPQRVDYGGPHQSFTDGTQTGERIALSLAQTWAQYAKPGSPVAQAGGAVNDLGPQVVAAGLAGANQVAVQVGFDAAQNLRALDADAAAGVGWSAIGNGAGTRVEATSAQLTGTDTLLLTFGSPLPANAKLYYGYGYGRLDGDNGAGQGNAVYDNAGMPIWVAARGLAVNGVAVISDVVLREAGGAVAVWELNGAGITEAAVLANPGNGWTLVPAADFSNDQRDDLLFQHADGRLAQWWTDGASITASFVLPFPGAEWKAVDGGDFNNDGRGDILFRHDNGDIAVWQMNGASILSAAVIASPGTAWQVAGTGDFNGDGKSDILFQHADGRIAQWLMDGTAIAGSSVPASLGAGMSIAGIGDFNGNGRDAILVRQADGKLTIWSTDGNAITAVTDVANLGLNWSVADVGDYNGDGKSDILFQNADSTVAQWLMDGATVASAAVVAYPGTEWQVA
jgi:hypothetical protein